MLTALEALMDGCHRVGRLLPEVQKCRLKQQKKANATQISWLFQKQFTLIKLICSSRLLTWS